MIKPVCMGHGLKRSYFSEKGHSGYMLLSSKSKFIFWKVHQSGPVGLWIQKVMPSGLEEVTPTYKLSLSYHWWACIFLVGTNLYVRQLDVFWAGQHDNPIPSLLYRGVSLQSVPIPVSPALSFQCLAGIPDSSSAFVGKIQEWQAIIFLTCRVISERCLYPSTCDCVAAPSLLLQWFLNVQLQTMTVEEKTKVPWHLKD